MNTQFVKVNLIAIASLLLCVLDIRISEASVTIDANRVGVENIAQNNSAQEWVRRGNSHYDSGRHSHALEAYDRALQINPDYEIAWTYRGATLRALRRYEESLVLGGRSRSTIIVLTESAMPARRIVERSTPQSTSFL